MKYPAAKDGDWIQPVGRGYKMRCCDCGLVHRLNFRVVSQKDGLIVSRRRFKPQFQATRDKRATSASRREQRRRN